jgi:integrase
MNRIDAWRMIQRRKADLGMKGQIGCHTFRATGITAYLGAGGTLGAGQVTLSHATRRQACQCCRACVMPVFISR